MENVHLSLLHNIHKGKLVLCHLDNLLDQSSINLILNLSNPICLSASFLHHFDLAYSYVLLSGKHWLRLQIDRLLLLLGPLISQILL